MEKIKYIYLSETKYNVLKFITSFIRQYKYSPTHKDAAMNFRYSRARAAAVFGELYLIGLISKGSSAHRNIRMTKEQIKAVPNLRYNKEFKMINKDKLERIKKENNFTITDVIKYHYPREEHANMRVKISRLTNKKKDDPKYYDASDLSKQVATFSNKHKKTNYSKNILLNQHTLIPVIGRNIDGWVKEDNTYSDFDSDHDYPNHNGIIESNLHGGSVIKLFKKRTTIDEVAVRKGHECILKTNDKYYCGCLTPLSSGGYKVETVCGKVILDDAKVEWCSVINNRLIYN